MTDQRIPDGKLRAAYDRLEVALELGDHEALVAAGRRAARLDPIEWRGSYNLARALVEASWPRVREARSRRRIREAARICEALLASGSVPRAYAGEARFLIGNCALALGGEERGSSCGTQPSLDTAVEYFEQCLAIEQRPEWRMHLAKALLRQGRCIEALDELQLLPTLDHVGAGIRGDIYLYAANWLWMHRGLKEAALLEFRDGLSMAGGDPQNQAKLKCGVRQLEQEVGSAPRPTGPRPSTFARWVWSNRLSLIICPLCRIQTPEVLDVPVVQGVLDAPRRLLSVNDILDVTNAITRNFVASRWILAQGLGVHRTRVRRDVPVMGGSPSAVCDTKSGLVLQAVAGFYRVLEQIAFFINSYYRLGHKPNRVSFSRVWGDPGRRGNEVPRDRKDMHPKIRRVSSPGLSALHRLARSFETGAGKYHHLKRLRHDYEHRAVVIASEARELPFRWIQPGDLQASALCLGQLSRAALWYLGCAVSVSEHERAGRAQRRGHQVWNRDGGVERV